jgi:hypothetical protein
VVGVGPHGTVSLGVNSPRGILGLRVDGTYSLLRGKNTGRAGYSSNQPTFPDYGVITGGLNGVIRAPFGILASSGFYIFGGGGAAHVRSFVQSQREDTAATSRRAERHQAVLERRRRHRHRPPEGRSTSRAASCRSSPTASASTWSPSRSA